MKNNEKKGGKKIEREFFDPEIFESE